MDIYDEELTIGKFKKLLKLSNGNAKIKVSSKIDNKDYHIIGIDTDDENFILYIGDLI